MKVKALLAWAEQNTSPGNALCVHLCMLCFCARAYIFNNILSLTGANRQRVLQPVLKNIQLQYISAQDLMKVNTL